MSSSQPSQLSAHPRVSPKFRPSPARVHSLNVDSNDDDIICLSSELWYPPLDRSMSFEKIIAVTAAGAYNHAVDNVSASGPLEVPDNFASNITGRARLLNVNDLRLFSFPTPSSSLNSKSRLLPDWYFCLSSRHRDFWGQKSQSGGDIGFLIGPCMHCGIIPVAFTYLWVKYGDA